MNNRFKEFYGEIDKPIVKKTNELINKLVKINEELRNLKIPIRVYSKTTDYLDNFNEDNKRYFKDTVEYAINFASDF